MTDLQTRRSIEEKTVKILLSSVKSVEDVNMAKQAIRDYHEDTGMKTKAYRESIRDLREGAF